jgi:hypothetical protein
MCSTISANLIVASEDRLHCQNPGLRPATAENETVLGLDESLGQFNLIGVWLLVECGSLKEGRHATATRSEEEGTTHISRLSPFHA